MKKLTLLAAFVFGAFFTQAQDMQPQAESDTGLEIGLKVSPAVATNRFQSPSRFKFENENAKLRGSFGLVLDYFFAKNYAFSTGLEYSVKGGKINYVSSQATDSTAEGRTIDELNIQYIALPLGIKLYTNEVATDTRLYFNLGTSLNFRISSKINGDNFYGTNNDEIKANKRYNFFEADVVIGTGAEWQLGTNTKFFGGISYHRGLVNIDRYYDKALNSDDIAIRNNTFALDLGLKF